MTAQLPLDGIRVLEYAQYVAGPFAGMLLADLGADVIKVEPPRGDAWRRYEPFAEGESRYFYALNRNKRSVVIDLKDESCREASRALIRTADAVLHNLPPDRARRFELDREQRARAQPGGRLVLRLGARQRRSGVIPNGIRPRRAGAFGTADGGGAGLRSRSPARRRDRDGRLHGGTAGGHRRTRRPPRARARRRARPRGLAAGRRARGPGAAVRLG